MEFSLSDMPPWVGMALSAGIAAVVGAVVGVIVARRSASAQVQSADPYLEPAENAPISRENPAFKKLQSILQARGISAKEQDTRLRDFAGEYAVIHRKLRDMRSAIPENDAQRVKALAALEDGEFETAIGLTEELGRTEGDEGREMRERSARLLAAGAQAKIVAADLYMILMAPENARDLYEQAVDDLPPMADERRAEVLNKLGTACYQCGDTDAAVKAFTRGLRLLEKTIGSDHPDIATALNNMALIHYSKGNLEQAEPLYRRALMIDERVLGYDHPGVATDLNNLALLYKKQGNLEAAEPLLKRALSIKERTFDPGHPSLVTGLKNYASLLRSLGRTQEAKEYEARAASLPPSRTDSAA